MNRRALWLSLFVAPLAFGGAVRSVARHFLFRTDRAVATFVPADARLETTTARDGTVVHALELDANPDAPVVVHFHNNSETMAGPLAMARALRAHGLGVLLVEYRGYGLSAPGSPSEQGLYHDAAAALDWLRARGVDRDRVVLSGMSLGTGVAAEMARRGLGSALVLFAPYTSIPDLVTDRVPFLPARWLVPDHFDTLSKAGSIDVPTLVVHGDDDEVVPFWMGARVAGAIAGARLLRVRGAHHGDLFARDADDVVAAIQRVVARRRRRGGGPKPGGSRARRP